MSLFVIKVTLFFCSWYCSIFVPHYIFFNFFFVIITKMRTWMMSLMSNEWRGQLAWVLKVLAWMHLCLWLIIKKRKNKGNQSPNKNLFKINKIKKCEGLLSFAVMLFFLTLNIFFLLVISSFISRYMFLLEWGRRSLHL